jgi:hypothetical protein
MIATTTMISMSVKARHFQFPISNFQFFPQESLGALGNRRLAIDNLISVDG